MFKVVIDEAKCTGCMACEIACSYHHRQVFDPGIASIEIHKHGEREESIAITLHKAVSKDLGQANRHLPCNRCRGETDPLCARFCAPGALSTTGEVTR